MSATRNTADKAESLGETTPDGSDVSADPVSTLDWSVEESFDSIRDEWLGLQNSAVLTLFQHLEWCETWYESAGRESGAQLRIITARDSGRLVLLFPMVLHKKVGLNCLTWMCGIWNDYNVPIADAALVSRLSPETSGTIWRKIESLNPDANFISLEKQPRQLCGRANPFLLSTETESDAAHAISLGTDWDTFEKERWGRSTRKDVRKKRNHLERIGKLTFRRIETESERKSYIDRVLQWKSQDLDKKGARNPFHDECFWRFFREITHWNRFDIYALELNSEPIAAAFALAEDQSSLVYQSSYDASYERESPGRLLFQEMIRDHIEAGKTSLDFGYGDEDYKQRLTDRRLTLVRGLYSSGFIGKLACFVERVILVLKKTVKSNPSLLKLYYTLRARRRSEQD